MADTNSPYPQYSWGIDRATGNLSIAYMNDNNLLIIDNVLQNKQPRKLLDNGFNPAWY